MDRAVLRRCLRARHWSCCPGFRIVTSLKTALWTPTPNDVSSTRTSLNISSSILSYRFKYTESVGGGMALSIHLNGRLLICARHCMICVETPDSRICDTRNGNLKDTFGFVWKCWVYSTIGYNGVHYFQTHPFTIHSKRIPRFSWILLAHLQEQFPHSTSWLKKWPLWGVPTHKWLWTSRNIPWFVINLSIYGPYPLAN